MPEYNILNSSCDWCELDVPVRRLVDTFDQPLMSICEACDYQREFLPNNKEGSAMSINNLFFSLLHNLEVMKGASYHWYCTELDLSETGHELQLERPAYDEDEFQSLLADLDVEYKLAMSQYDNYESIVIQILEDQEAAHPNGCLCQVCFDAGLCPIEPTDFGEFLNNKKENVMNTHKCYGITKKGEACKKTDVRPVDLLVKQSQAIPAADVNPNNMGAGWLFYGEVPLCGTHAKQYQLTIQSLTRLTEAKIQAIKEVQKEMREFPYATNPGDADMLDMELAELEKQKHILCGNCKSYHSIKEEVKDCYRGHKIVKTAVKNNGVLCGKCKSHHPTPADVKACYTK